MEKVKDRRFLVAVALASAVVLLFVCWPSAAVESVYPVDRVRNLLTRRIWPAVAGVFRSASVAAENQSLRREVGLLALARDDVDRLEAENVRLRAALSFRERSSGSWIPAEVLSSGGGSAGVRRLVRLSKGAAAGVVSGAAVVVPEGLVGRVASVTPHTCSVMLVTDPALRVACEVETGAAARVPRGILCGGGDDWQEIRYLTGASGLVASRQRVVTSGLGGVFPRGISVGHLVGLEGSSGSVQLAADLTALDFAFIRRED